MSTSARPRRTRAVAGRPDRRPERGARMAGVSSTVAASHRVRVPVTTVWSTPASPRPVDAPVVADEPDAVQWLAALDANSAHGESGHGRVGLHGRVETQLLLGEPVTVTETDASGRWSHVVAPWQI